MHVPSSLAVVLALIGLQHAATAREPGRKLTLQSVGHGIELSDQPAHATMHAATPDEAHARGGSGASDVAYTAEAEMDRVTRLPGWGPLAPLNMFAGYITVDEAAGRALFYVLVESQHSVAEDPLVLWLNGSIGGGFMSELGPFFPKPDGRSLQANPRAWNRAATMVFLEVPSGVGFSYSNTSSDRFVGDEGVAVDSHTFLKGLLARFPHLRKNDLYLSGESYAGHYVPMLAQQIVRGNADGGTEPLNLRGFLVGNPSTNRVTDRLGGGDYLWSHGLISDETAQEIQERCDRAPGGGEGPVSLEHEAACDKAFERANREMGNINIYEIYADVCLPRQARSEAKALARALRRNGTLATWAALRHGRLAAGAAAKVAGQASLRDDGQYDPCIDGEVETYLNLPEVQRALHVNQTVKLPGRWTDCSDVVQYDERDPWNSMVPVYKDLISSGDLRILVFSGDVDGMVSLVGTRRWTAGLGLKTKRSWRPWLSATEQVAGYIIDYDGLTFATVRNAGHMVPYVQPERMYRLFTSFINGTSP